jgi:hypothetical protein
MRQDPLQALQAGSRTVPSMHRKPRLLIAGATGTLGNEVLRQLAGSPAFGGTHVLAREPIRPGLRGVAVTRVGAGPPSSWTPADAEVGIVLFDPPRLFYDRERALWTPLPEELPGLAKWMRASGVRTLAVVLPHAQGRLPEALKRGLASLDEQAVAALGFERLLIIRSPQKPGADAGASFPVRIARFMLSAFQYMVPSSEQPVRASKVAALLAAALEIAPPGIHVAAPETVWRAAQGDLRAVAAEWLRA